MNRLAILLLLLALVFSAKAQEGTSISIYFQTNVDKASTGEINRLHTMLKDKDCGLCSITLNGNTDADGSDEFNQKLSERRMENIQSFLSKNYACFKITKAEANGETKPLNENKTEAEKSKNRRVELTFTCKTMPEEVVEKPKQKPVWDDIVSAPWRNILDCSTKSNALMDANNGVMVLVDEYTYGQDEAQIQLQFYQCINKQQAFSQHFTTMTKDDRLLESAGMFRMIATKDGKEIQPIKNNGIHVFIPMTPDRAKNFASFASSSSDNYTVWEPITSNQNHSFYNPKQSINRLFESRAEGVVGECGLFWCKIKSLFSAKYRARRNTILTAQVSANKDLMRVYSLFGKELKDKFPTIEAYTKFLINNDKETVLNELGDQIPGFDDLSYYILDLPNSKWINCDAFVNDQNLTDVKIDEPHHADSDIRLFFDNRFSIMKPTSGLLGKAKFSNVLVGELVTLVILKKLGNILYLSKESFSVGQTPKINFRKINTKDLENVFPRE